MSKPGIMDRLRQATWPQHQHAEGRELQRALAKGALPCDTYIELLGQRLLIHCPLERELRRLRDADTRLRDVVREELFQESNLRRDLAHFAVNPDDVVPASATRRLIAEIGRMAKKQPVALLGHYYVFEGSKNGARMIASALRDAYELPSPEGLCYVDPHGSQQRVLWKAFKAAMNAVDFTEREQEAMVAAARCTFTLVSELDDELYAPTPAVAERPR
jgi:heme oxygenase